MKISYLLYNKKLGILFAVLIAIILYLYFPSVEKYELYKPGVPTLKKEFILIVPEQRNFAISEQEYECLIDLNKSFLDKNELSLLCAKKQFCELYHFLKEKNLDKMPFLLYVDRFI